MKTQTSPNSPKKFSQMMHSSKPPQQIGKIMDSLSLQQKLKDNLLESETGIYDVEIIVKLIENLFSDKMLYQNRKFKHRLLQSRKGWIKIQQVLNLPQLKKALQEIQLFNMISRQNLIGFISIQIKDKSSTLMANKNYIKRKVPFVDKIKNTKPIYIENYPEQSKMKTIEQILGGITQIYKTKFQIGKQWGYVYAAQPEKIIEYSQTAKQRIRQFQLDEQQQQYDQQIPQKDRQYKESLLGVCSFEHILKSNIPKNIQLDLGNKYYRPYVLEFKQQLQQQIYAKLTDQVKKLINGVDSQAVKEMIRLYNQLKQIKYRFTDYKYQKQLFKQLIKVHFDISNSNLPNDFLDYSQIRYKEQIIQLNHQYQLYYPQNTQQDMNPGWESDMFSQIRQDMQKQQKDQLYKQFIQFILESMINQIYHQFKIQLRKGINDWAQFYYPNQRFNNGNLGGLTNYRKQQYSSNVCRMLSKRDQQQIDNYIQGYLPSDINKKQQNKDSNIDIII